jgi:hypothetical protein
MGVNTAVTVEPREWARPGLTYDLYSAPAQEWFSVADIAAVARLARRYGSVAAMESALARLDLAVPALATPPPPSSRWFPRRAWSSAPTMPRLAVVRPPLATGWAPPSGAWHPLPPVEVSIARARPDVVGLFAWGVSWRLLLAGSVAMVLLGGVPGLPAGWMLLGAVGLAIGGLWQRLWRRGDVAGAAWRAVMVALAVVGAVGVPRLLAGVVAAGVGLCLVEPAVGIVRRARGASPGWIAPPPQ